MKDSEILKQCKAIISNPACWTQGASARDAAGDICAFGGEDAVCWCSIGVLGKVYIDKAHIIAEHHFWPFTDNKSVASYNDAHTHEEVMALWDKAIEAAEKEERK